MVKAIKITLLSIVCIALVLFMVTLINNGFKFENIKPKLIFEETYEITDINKIDVFVKSSDINIFESEDDKIKVEIHGSNKDRVIVDNKDGSLSIDVKRKKKVCIGICYGNKINIYVPKEYEGAFNIESTSGDISSKLQSYNDYKIKVTSGDIKLNNVKNLSGKSTSGDVEINNISESINFVSTSGDYDINYFEVNKDSSIKVTSGDVEIDTLKNAYVNASVKSGDIDIKKNDRYAEYELKIKTTSGDIEVN